MTRQDFRLLVAPISLTAPIHPVVRAQKVVRPALMRPALVRRSARTGAARPA